MLILSFRDYVTDELTGVQRFIPIRSDDTRIHTCFLEYLDSKVVVDDIIHSKLESMWSTSISAYEKLQLDSQPLLATARKQNLALGHQSANRGMIFFAFKHLSMISQK